MPAFYESFLWITQTFPFRNPDLHHGLLGAFVGEALILDELVTLEVPLLDPDKQAIPAKVVRALGTEYGFQFTALSAEQRRQIRATLKGHPVIPYHGNRR